MVFMQSTCLYIALNFTNKGAPDCVYYVDIHK